MILQFLDKYRDLGLLLLRIGIGVAFMVHGWPKLTGGPEGWVENGSRLEVALGIGFLPAFWGFMAAVAEFFGGLLLALGFLFRPALFLLACTMAVALLWHVSQGDGFTGYSHALESLILFLSLMLIGPGRYSLDERTAGGVPGRRGTRF